MEKTLGRKAFFLYPDGRVVPGVLDALRKREFEVYGFQSHKIIGKILGFYENSVLFIWADEGPGPAGWAELIREIHPENKIPESTSDAVMYALVKRGRKSPEYEALASAIGLAFLIDIPDESEKLTERIGTILEAISARGQRQYVRFGGAGQIVTSLYAAHGDAGVSGTVHDISSVGMSCSFSEEVDFNPKDRIDQIELSIQDQRYRVGGFILLRRQDPSGRPVYVIMFDRKSVGAAQDPIRRFINDSLKAQVEKRLEAQPL